MTEIPMKALEAKGSKELLTREERLVWILGDMMNAAENYFGVENPKRLGHINSAAIRIIDEVLRAENVRMLLVESDRAVCVGGRWDGWLFWLHPNGIWVLARKLPETEPTIDPLFSEKSA